MQMPKTAMPTRRAYDNKAVGFLRLFLSEIASGVSGKVGFGVSVKGDPHFRAVTSILSAVTLILGL